MVILSSDLPVRKISFRGRKSNKMGGKKSTPTPPEDFDKPFRNVDWNAKELLKSQLSGFQFNHPGISQFRILLHGPVGAGKSCIINSTESVFKGRIVVKAEEETSAGKSCTKTFNPASPLIDSDPDFITEPRPDDKVHCLVSVVPAASISQMAEDVIQKMKTVRKKAVSLGIPHVVLMTKIDCLGPLVKKDLSQVYKSRKIKEKMEVCSQRLGPPMKCIFPVSNYYEESEINEKKDVLILMALKEILFGFVKDYFEDGNI
ncbi:interferon-induced protein 44 [Ictalurus punctatus]|uniref:Interferon-induced protein 44 n=1 Tax=Ictalurus punctatus TaxID=7998 RepID=A0A9F7TED0_ICTPU|nr:interferon-induced protein 44 [Ictalurus punctatus]